MEADGLLRRAPHTGDGRAKALELTDAGRRLLAAVEEAYAELEAGWADVVGRDRLEAVRQDLLAVLRSENDGDLPPVRPTW
jgi:DNA-binding MarR family transcriptional regulator